MMISPFFNLPVIVVFIFFAVTGVLLKIRGY
jgi:hypothetical protein